MPQDDFLHGTATTRAARSPELARAEADIERARTRVTDAMMALREAVARRTDWRGWFRNRPVTCLAAALALGFLLGHRPRAGASYPRTRRRSSWR